MNDMSFRDEMSFRIVGTVVKKGEEFGVVLPEYIVEKWNLKEGQELGIISIRKC